MSTIAMVRCRTPIAPLLVALACTPQVPGDGTRSPAGDPAAVGAPIDEAATAITAARGRCKDTCCFEQLPHWATLRSPELRGHDGAALRDDLRAIVQGDSEPIRRGLAMLWLGSHRDLADVELLEAQLGVTATAWFVPEHEPQQRSERCYEIAEWRARPVGEIAVEALGKITGTSFSSVDEYVAWRRKNPRPEDALAFWSARLPIESAAPGCASTAKAFGARDPTRLLLLAHKRRYNHDDPARICPTPRQLREAFAARGTTILEVLQHSERWSQETSFDDVAGWILLEAEHLLERGDADAIEALLGKEPFAGNETLRGLVAVATSRLDPARAQRLLREQQPTLRDPPPEFSTAFAASFPADPIVLTWLQRDPEDRCEIEMRGDAVIAGLVDAGAEGKQTLVRFVADPTSDLEHRAVLVRLLAEAAVAQGGAKRDFECAEGLPHRRCLKTRKDRVEAALAKALPVCLAKIRAWYRVT